MKSIYKYLTGSISLITTLLVVISCSSEYEYKTDYSSYKDVKLNVELVDDNNVLNVKRANGTHVLTIGVTPADVFIDSKAYIYEISDKTIATAEKDGTLNLLKVGETTITVKFRGNQEIFTTCTLKVAPTLVTELKVSTRTISVEEGKTLDLTEYINAIPLSADNTVLNFVVKEGYEEIAEVTEGSTVFGKQKGTAVIVATTTDGSNLSAEMTVNVTGKIPVSEIKLNAVDKLQGKTIGINQNFNLSSAIKVLPSNASNPILKYKVTEGSNTVSIDENTGLFTTLAPGNVKIKVETTDGSGIFSELSFSVDNTIKFFEPALWIPDTSIRYSKNGQNYVTDGNTGMPEHLFDGSTTTFLSLVKPGKTYDGYKADPISTPLYFTIDMGAPNKFNCIKWAHRSINNYPYLRAWGIAMYGSNDGVSYTEIKSNIDIPYSSNAAPLEIDIPESEYRYIKVQYTKWSDIAGGEKSGSSIQVAEFNLGKK